MWGKVEAAKSGILLHKENYADKGSVFSRIRTFEYPTHEIPNDDTKNILIKINLHLLLMHVCMLFLSVSG